MNPKKKRNRIAIVVAILVVLGVAGAYGVFALASGGDAPPPVALASEATGGATASAQGLDGTWTLEASGSFVGYRVQEKLASLPAPSEAVGRTSAVQGSLTVDGLKVSSVNVTADLTQLKSDKALRDERIKELGPQTAQFPTASFKLTSPISFASKPPEGQSVKATAKGELTMHGETNPVSVPVQARWEPGEIDVVGSIPITWSDYGIEAPNFFFVSVEDHGTVEFQLTFSRS